MRTELFNVHPMKVQFFRDMRAWVRRRPRPGARLLDIASHDFRMAYLFPGVHYTGADIEPGRLAAGVARHKGQDFDAVCCDIRSIPFADATFDIVICTHTLIHLTGARRKGRAMGELLRVLGPGGDLVFNITDWREWADEMEADMRTRFARVTVLRHRRALMTWWERRVSGPVHQRGWRGLTALAGLVSPLIHLADRFGAPTMTLLICEDHRPRPWDGPKPPQSRFSNQ